MDYFRGSYTPEMAKDFNRSRTDEICADYWRLEGYSGHPFSEKKSCPNLYVIRDGDTLLVFDSGLYLNYRERLLKKISEYESKGIKRFILLNSHGHFDHVVNNDIILEVNFPEVRLLISEADRPCLDFTNYALKDEKEINQYYDPESIGEPSLSSITAGLNIASMADRAEFLRLDDRVKHNFGGVDLDGWEIGRFFVVHDATQTPGHCCLYDPENKIMNLGDLPLEINPIQMGSSLAASIETCKRFKHMAEQGYIKVVVDAHRVTSFLREMYEAMDIKPLSDIFMKPWAKGQDECTEYFRTWGEGYFEVLRKEVLAAHARLGEATVDEIARELKKSNNQVVKNKIAISYPNRPSRIGVWISVVLKENRALRREEGGRIVFTPAVNQL